MSIKNKYYTVMIVPEKTSDVRRLVVPAWILRTGAIVIAFVALLGAVMFFDYWSVMGQISENKQLNIENRRLRQQVQIFKNKVATIETTVDRVKTFATRLKVITNIEDRDGLLQSLNNGNLPDAATNIGGFKALSTAKPNSGPAPTASQVPAPPAQADATKPITTSQAELPSSSLPEDALLQRDYAELDTKLAGLNQNSLYVEQMLQDLCELLADQRAFLAALPTLKPVIGYYTSGFGVRHSPLGDGRVKMHEGMDIANREGTPVRAPADGIVIFAGIKSGYGNTLIIDHGYGLETWYGHTRRILVSKGQRVKKGDNIALLGNTGRSTGPHLHYEVRVHGTPIDPLSYILEDT
ncbi:MAG: M23 family metallopeptidase [Oligoflexia bacterium]|nr:M23 family metallopeptidase [Oligoflexia bacterium]